MSEQLGGPPSTGTPADKRLKQNPNTPKIGTERPGTGSTSAHPRDLAKNAEHTKIKSEMRPR